MLDLYGPRRGAGQGGHGRGGDRAGSRRAVNRTAADPVEVYLILHDVVVLGMPVDEVVEFKALEPDAVVVVTGRRQS